MSIIQFFHVTKNMVRVSREIIVPIQMTIDEIDIDALY